MGELFGYVRVSTRQQDETRQREALIKAGVPAKNIYCDKQSGKDFERPQYVLLKEHILRTGDMLYVLSLDRLGRTYKQMGVEWSTFAESGIGVKILDFPILDTTEVKDSGLDTRFVADLVFSVMSYLADKERTQIIERTSQGRAVAKAKGVKFGRKQVKLPADFDTLALEWKTGKKRLCDCLAQSHMKRTSFVKYANIRYEVLRNSGDSPALGSDIQAD